MSDLIPDNFENPYDRLENLELFVEAQNETLQQLAHQIQEHANNFVEISKALVQMARAFEVIKKQNINLQQQTQRLHFRLQQLENEE